MPSNPFTVDADLTSGLRGLSEGIQSYRQQQKAKDASAALADYLSAGQQQTDDPAAAPVTGGTPMQAYGQGQGMFPAQDSTQAAQQGLSADNIHPDNITMEHILDPTNTKHERMLLDDYGITPDKHQEIEDFADKFKNASDAELGGLIKDRVSSIVDRGGDAQHTAQLMSMDPETARQHVDAAALLTKRDAIRRIAMNDPQMAYKIMSDEQASRKADIAERRQEAIMQHFMTKDAQGQQRLDEGDWSAPQLQLSPDGKGMVAISINKKTNEIKTTPVDAKFKPSGGTAGSYDVNAPLTDDEKQIRDAIISGKQSPLTISGRSPSNLKIMADVRRQSNGAYDPKDYFAQKVLQTKMASGDMGKNVRSLNVVQTHLDAFDKVADDLGGDVNSQTFRKASQALSKEFGGVDIPRFDVAKQIVSDELVKSIVGGQNSDADRQHMQEIFSRANTPEQLHDAIKEARILVGGQLQGMRQQIRGAGLGDDYFNRFLDPRNVESSGGAAPSGESAQERIARIKAGRNATK